MHLSVLLGFLMLTGTIAAAPRPDSRGPRARMLAAPMPVYPEAAIRQQVTGRGVFRIDMDMETGRPLRVVALQSTGSPLLDRAAVQGLRQWRAAAGTVRTIQLPLVFRLTARGPSVRFE